MIVPMIHRRLCRDDLARLVVEIAQTDPTRTRSAVRALEDGRVDALLDLPVALDAVRGRGGTPAPLPLSLLWYIPVRAALRARGEDDISLADYAATLPVVFVSSGTIHRVARGEVAITSWTRAIDALPPNTVAQGERAASCAALALWWAGCFPERVKARGGVGMLRAYVDFAAAALQRSATILGAMEPDAAALFAKAAARAAMICGVLAEVRREYLGRRGEPLKARLGRLAAGGAAPPGPDATRP